MQLNELKTLNQFFFNENLITKTKAKLLDANLNEFKRVVFFHQASAELELILNLHRNPQ